VAPQAAASATTRYSDKRSDNDTLEVATVMQQIIKLSEAVPEEDKIMIITKMVFNLLTYLLTELRSS
jgi:hypothetical protein